jgi:polyhydroxybutyrate depolymerase
MIAGCVPVMPSGDVDSSGTYLVVTDRVTGAFRRTYHVHLPPYALDRGDLPLVVVVHGAFDTAAGMERYTGFSDIADREGFIVLYPNGIGILGLLQHWNAGHCCGKAAHDGIDDVGFVAAAIQEVTDRFPVNPQKIYMVGFSNGGMFTYRFAAERGELLAGAAALAASVNSVVVGDSRPQAPPDPATPVPMIIIHGKDDTDVPYSGSPSQRGGTPRIYWSVDESVRTWRVRNGCRPSPQTSQLFSGAVQVKRWSDCRSGAAVLLYTIDGWGHVWPGPYFTDALEEGNPLKGFDAAEIIWSAFESADP